VEFRQRRLVDARLAVKPIAIGQARQLHKIAIPLQIASQQKHVKRALPAGRSRVIAPVARRHVRLHADDRFDAFLPAFVIELDDAEHAAVVADGDRRHPQSFDPPDQVRNPAGPVQQRIMRMHMKMNKRRFSHARIVRTNRRRDKCPCGPASIR